MESEIYGKIIALPHLFFLDMWNITSVGPLNGQAKVVGGNMATNGMAWQLPLRENIFF